MFVGQVDLGNGTALELVIVPLKGSQLDGRWDAGTDLLMICNVGSGRCCTCRINDHENRFVDSLGLSPGDAVPLSAWLKSHRAAIPA
jgi:hypothetical protein